LVLRVELLLKTDSGYPKDLICSFRFWFLVCYAATQLATQLRQRCIQVVCSNKEARKRLTESNGTPAMDPGHMIIDLTYVFACYCEEDIRIHKQTMNRTKYTWKITDYLSRLSLICKHFSCCARVLCGLPLQFIWILAMFLKIHCLC